MGNRQRVLVSELSGRQNILRQVKEIGLGNEEEWAGGKASLILERVKALESIGFSFEGAPASVELMLLHAGGTYVRERGPPSFSLR